MLCVWSALEQVSHTRSLPPRRQITGASSQCQLARRGRLPGSPAPHSTTRGTPQHQTANQPSAPVPAAWACTSALCCVLDPDELSHLAAGVGIASMGVMRPELVMKSIVPVVMAGVLGIYGLIIAVIISTGGELLSPLGPASAER